MRTPEIIREYEIRVENTTGQLLKRLPRIKCTQQMIELRARLLYTAAKIKGEDLNVTFAPVLRVLQ